MSGPGFSQDLRQRQTQSLVLAPQLRQSLKILQVAALDLRSVIQEELQANPTLEEQPMDDDSNINNSDSRKKLSIPVLLRTRVLLHDSAYQCQGGNIITWFEPFGASQQKSQKERILK